jgi:hypothetical protein
LLSARQITVMGIAAGVAAPVLGLTSRSSSAMVASPRTPEAASEPDFAPVGEQDDDLASSLCSMRRRVNPRKPSWTPAFCRSLAAGVLDSARRHDLSPALVLAVMINESDLDEKAARLSHPAGAVAKDSGLMGIRCVLSKGRCTNGLVRGLPWRTVMDPLTNVELGARYLAHYRDGGGRSLVTVRTRMADGSVRSKVRNLPCAHRDHAWWAHYNHGTRYIKHGEARFYPHHVAVLQDVLADGLGLDREPVTRRYTLAGLQRAGRLGAERYVQLVSRIRSALTRNTLAAATTAPGDGPAALCPTATTDEAPWWRRL